MTLQEQRDRQDMAIAMARSGNYSLEAIQDTCGYGSMLCVTQMLRNCGVKPFPKTENRLAKDRRNARILEMRESGMTHLEIAEGLGVTSSVISAVLRNAGVKGKLDNKLRRTKKRTCKWCGREFETWNEQKLFCTSQCEKAESHARNDVVRRMKRKAADVDKDITLAKVASKHGDICALCGEPVDWNDYKVINGKRCARRRYPSIDHIVPISKGGTHSWRNVQLAHLGCNASKGARNG